MKRVFVILGLCLCILAGVWRPVGTSHFRMFQDRRPVQTTILGPSGRKLGTFFEGLPPNPLYSIDRIVAEQKRINGRATCA